MITKFARLEFELFTKPSKSDFYEFIKIRHRINELEHLVHVFLNTVSYHNWIIINHRRDAEGAKKLFFCFSLRGRKAKTFII